MIAPAVPPSAKLLQAFITSAMYASTMVMAEKCADAQRIPNAIPGIPAMSIHALVMFAKVTMIAQPDISATMVHV